MRRELSILDISKGAGPDNIHSQVVRWSADFLAEPLDKLLANPLKTAAVPSHCSLAIICPILKKSDPEGVFNYHPVSLTCIVC